MPRTLSTQAMNAVMAATTNEAFLLLVTFTHVPTAETFRVVLNTENITSNGNLFTATYFQFTLPETSNQAPQGCSITVDNVDQQMVPLLRSITEPLQVTLQVVLASQPDTVELELADLLLRDVTWDSNQIQGNLVADDPLNQAFPAHLYEPRTFQGLF